jgi:hypothetical protein
MGMGLSAASVDTFPAFLRQSRGFVTRHVRVLVKRLSGSMSARALSHVSGKGTAK